MTTHQPSARSSDFRPSTTRRSPWWLAADVTAVTLFAAIGRRSHDEGLNLAGIAQTAGPFLAGAALGWLASRAWDRPTAVVPTGVVTWACTLVGGMVLRVLTGGSTQLSFIIVAGTFLAIFLIGWRTLVNRLG